MRCTELASGTQQCALLAEGSMQCEVLSSRMVPAGSRPVQPEIGAQLECVVQVCFYAMLLCCLRYSRRLWCQAISRTRLRYAAMPCPVLAQLRLCDARY
eukprot:978884-Rhodomonas_salina.3